MKGTESFFLQGYSRKDVNCISELVEVEFISSQPKPLHGLSINYTRGEIGFAASFQFT
jgi:hypothetical protein